jgi:hypothetical protein
LLGASGIRKRQDREEERYHEQRTRLAARRQSRMLRHWLEFT